MSRPPAWVRSTWRRSSWNGAPGESPPDGFTHLYLPDKFRSRGAGRLTPERRSAMTHTTQTPQPPAGTSRRRFFRRAAIVTLIAALATGIGLKAFAYGHGFGGWHRGGFMGGTIDPTRLDDPLDRRLKHLCVEADPTGPHTHQLAPIVKAAA